MADNVYPQALSPYSRQRDQKRPKQTYPQSTSWKIQQSLSQSKKGEAQIVSCPILFSPALKNPSLTLSSLLKSSRNISFIPWQTWGQLPAPLITVSSFCNLAVERLKGESEGSLKCINTPSQHEGQEGFFFPLSFLIGPCRVMEVVGWRWSRLEDWNK